jgi:serine phosphatase RsbU (regulator of sigma subunit)
MEVSKDLSVSFPPLGLLPSIHVTDRQQTPSPLGFKDHYQMNEWVILNDGDIFLLHTDGVGDHTNGNEDYVTRRLEDKLREVKHESAAQIFRSLIADIQAFANPTDDMSLVVIKRISRE